MLPAEEHPAPWWFVVAHRFWPERCREVPAPTDPERIILRQVALWYRYLYLQQFAGSEELEWMHSHQWRLTLALGLFGGYLEERLVGFGRGANRFRWRSAPYCYIMSSAVVHHVLNPTRGHTSLFLGLWRNDDLKHYVPSDTPVTWEQHIQRKVKRI